MATTIKDIAKKLNISYSTVSKGLNDSSEISESTKKKIRKAAKELNYTPNAIAQGLVTKRTKTIGLIIPDITNPFYPEIAMGIEETASLNGYSVILCNSNWNNQKERDYLDLLIGKKVDGIILAPIGEENLELNEFELPIVMVGKRNGYSTKSYVVVDDKRGGFLATEHLIKIGRKKIMFIGGKENVQSNKERLEGYMKALDRYGIPIDEGLIRSGNFKIESGYILMKEALKNGAICDAVFAGNDMLALGAIQAIQERNIKVPDKIAVVGFDDISFAKLPEISLTTVAQPKYEMGILAAKMLLDKIDNTKKKIESIILPPELVVRNTSIVKI